ncbi:Succinate dehydrogenase/fumarate reductase flavoprotein, catalytic domain [Phytophthora cactorum]|nr:Succinate dehydrogenase/fumarate reductase flavoprotein, catalytic domain [Phytophthora cactorum]
MTPAPFSAPKANSTDPRRHLNGSTLLRRASSASPAYDTIECKALILGCGVAGNAAALRLANQGVKVTMLAAAEDPNNCATYYAQGGIIYKSEDDTPALLSSDVHRAGAGVCEDIAVQKLAVEGPGRVEEMLLEVAKVPFTRKDDGELALTLEASHNAVQDHPNIVLLTGRSAFELVTNNAGECVGALTVSTKGKVEHYRAPFTLLATGGVGDVYKNTSNPEGARGEGVALAARAGAKLKNMQFVQFHPTTLYIPDERRFLLTEAYVVKEPSYATSAAVPLPRLPPGRELAPRDVVARLILAEMEKQDEPCMFLDISHEDADWIKSRFPTIYQHCLDRGIDMTKDPMPVVPAAHYHCGGVEVDLQGRTSVPGLYAAGEVSCTGLHGANRLASTSLLEGLVSKKEDDPFANLNGFRDPYPNEIEEVMLATQRIMWESVGPIRSTAGMDSAVDKLALLEVKADKLHQECRVTRETAGLRNAVRAAKEIALAALNSPLSVGTHYIVKDVRTSAYKSIIKHMPARRVTKSEAKASAAAAAEKHHEQLDERQLWLPSLETALSLLVLPRAASALLSPIADCDETFNYWEPLHYLLYRFGFQTWEYSPVYALRSYFYLLLHYVVVKLTAFGSTLGLLADQKLLLFYGLRAALGLLSAYAEALFYQSTSHALDAAPRAIYCIFYSSTRASSTPARPSYPAPSRWCLSCCLVRWVLPAWNIVVYNVLSNETDSTLYGTEPLSYYLLNLALNFNVVALLADLQRCLYSLYLVTMKREWYRFPASFFIPSNTTKVEFVKSSFSGLLPKSFEQHENGTSIIPSATNNQNREEPSRYVPLETCDYVVDLNLPGQQEIKFWEEPATWELVHSEPFLTQNDPSRRTDRSTSPSSLHNT